MYMQSRKLIVASGLALAMVTISGEVTAGVALAPVAAPAPMLPATPAIPTPSDAGSTLDSKKPATPTVKTPGKPQTPALPNGGEGSAAGSVTSPAANVDASGNAKLSNGKVSHSARANKNVKPLNTSKATSLSPNDLSASGSASAKTTMPKKK